MATLAETPAPQGVSALELARRHGASLAVGLFLLLLLLHGVLPAWSLVPPEAWALPFAKWINEFVVFLQEDLGLVVVTRGIADAVSFLLDIVRNLLTGGRRGFGLPALPWVMLVALAVIWGHYLKGWRLAALAGGTVFYLALFGQWKNAMLTLSMVFVTVPLAVLLGLGLGILAFKSRRAEQALNPLLNIMQSLPHFAYLIPVVVFFGVGQHAGALATMIFATPPMVRMTLLGLKGVPENVVEAGMMAGCTRAQLLFTVQVPAARNAIMVGVNQVIMQCLAMVVIASFIGASGLGYDLLLKLQSLRIGQALETGIAVVLIAIALDRLSQAWAEKQPLHREQQPWWREHIHLILAVIAVVGSLLLAQVLPEARRFPRSLTLTTAPLWDGLVDWITLNLFDALQAVRGFMLVEVLIPLRDGFLWLPWVAVVAFAAGLAWTFGGLRAAATVAGFLLFIVLSGWWERAMITSYMVFSALVICVLIGIPVGIWAASREWRFKTMQVMCDTFQTFPSFIYLIPVIMLFQVSDLTVILAVVIYSVIPSIRYTMIGLRAVPSQIVEAGLTSGCTPLQMLWKIKLPLALPTIMVGINQTILFSLFMVIIAAFIGTRDLGQEMMRALSASDTGKGLVLGFCVAFLGLTADRIISDWSAHRKRQLGLA